MRPELKPLLIAIFCFIAVISGYIGFVSIKGLDYSVMAAQIDFNQPVGEIYGDSVVGQSFIATEDNFSRVDILFTTYERINTKNVIFSLKDDSSSIELFKIEMNASEIHDNKYYSIIFDPILNSKNKRYMFTISSPESIPGNAVSVYKTTSDSYPLGLGYINNEAISGDITFKTFNKYSNKFFLFTLLEIIYSDIYFFVLYNLTLILAIVILINIHIKGTVPNKL